MLFVVNKGTQACQSAFLVLGLVASFSTFDENLFHNAGIGIFPIIAQTHPRLHLIDVLSTSTRGTESIPFYFPFIDDYIKSFGFGKHSHRCSRGVHTTLRFCCRHTLHTMHPTFIFQRTIDISTSNRAYDFFISTSSSIRET